MLDHDCVSRTIVLKIVPQSGCERGLPWSLASLLILTLKIQISHLFFLVVALLCFSLLLLRRSSNSELMSTLLQALPAFLNDAAGRW